MRICSVILLLLAVSVPLAASQSGDVPYLRFLTNGYAVVASPNESMILTPSGDSQFSISPHLLLETNLLDAQIVVQYEVDGRVQKRSIMLSQRSADPYLRFKAVSREHQKNGEKITIELMTNVPDRVINELTMTVNGQRVALSDDRTFTFTAYHRKTRVEGKMLISNASLPITTHTEFTHNIEPDTDCELLDEDSRFTALCFSNKQGLQTVQFYLEERPVGRNGEFYYTSSMIEDLSLKYTVGDASHYFRIVNQDNEHLLVPTTPTTETERVQ